MWTIVVLPAPFGPRRANTEPAGTSRSMPSRTTCVPYDLRRPVARIADGTVAAVMPHLPCPPRRAADQMSRSSIGGCAPAVGDHLEQLRRDVLAEVLEGLEDLKRRLAGRAAVADVPDAEIAAPPGRLALGVHGREAWAVLGVEDELAPPAAVDPERVDPAGRGAEPLAEEDAHEPDLATLAGPHSYDDLVEALLATLLDLDIASEGDGDRRGEVAPPSSWARR